METVDFLIIGGGVAGLSAGAKLSPHGRTLVLEAEEALGFHSSGRSATFSHFGIGNAIVRGLTAYSRGFFLDSGAPVARRAAALFVASEQMLPDLSALDAAMRPFTAEIRAVGESEMLALFPPLRTGGDGIVQGLLCGDGIRLDSDALLQGYRRRILEAGGAVRTLCRAERIERKDGLWRVGCAAETFAAPVLINAAGAWADQVAGLAGVEPLGLRPLRRTIIVVDPPAGADVADWPFVKTVVDDFYILPESGRLMASPVDEVEATPCDAQPEEYDLALAAWKVEQYTTLPVRHISRRWAGLRTFSPDRTPAVGPAPGHDGFFWLAGQGGFGLQTAPAVAEAVESLLAGTKWPDGLARLGVEADMLAPERLFQKS